MPDITRREFMTSLGMAITAGGLAGMNLSEAMTLSIEKLAENVPTKILGKTGFKTKILGFGTLVNWKEMSEAKSDNLINTAMDMGITVFELGRVYNVSEVRFGRVIQKRRKEVFISSKCHKKTKDGMLKEIETSLVNLNTDYLDLYMLHDCSSLLEYDKATGENGAIEGLKQAQKEGKIRFIGITGHSVQAHMTAMRSGEFDVHVIPYNPVLRENERALNLAAKLNVAVECIKPFAQRGIIEYNPKDPYQLPQTLSVEECLRFTFSHPGVTVVIPGMSSIEQLKQNFAIAATFKPLIPEERTSLIAKANRIAGGVCGICEGKPCEKTCPWKVPISFLLSNLQYVNKLGWDDRRVGEEYAVLPHDYLDCDNCGDCEKVCPKKFEIRKDIKTAHNRINECRARFMLIHNLLT